MIVRNAKRLERLSSDILAISRIESGALKLNRETFSLSYLVAEAVRDAKARVAHDSTAVKISFQPDDIFINADREKITQVVSNLIANSIKFTQEGTITVMTRRNETTNQAIVTITDSGQGIDQEVLPKLFTKFVTKSNNGTGIGLYISKKIIEAHGGKLSGQNNPEGRGATFSFSLPMQHEGHDEIETPLGSPSANSDA